MNVLNYLSMYNDDDDDDDDASSGLHLYVDCIRSILKWILRMSNATPLLEF